MARETPYYGYMLLCSDQSIYTGLTNDISKRLESHNAGKGAKYTRSRKPVTLLAIWTCRNRSEAAKLELQLKAMPRTKKIALAKEQGIGILKVKNPWHPV